MRVSLSVLWSYGNAEPMAGFAVRVGALGPVGKEWDGPASTGVMPTGGRQ
jgi:hypothetical protein